MNAQFRKIEDIESMPATTTLDIMGVVENVEPHGTITRRDGTETEKRNITMRDISNKSIEVTLWGGHAENPGNQLEEARPCILFRLFFTAKPLK